MMDYLSLCLICKDENDYLSEWLDFHILMGVERFYIYDNESRVSLRETLNQYIERGWVVVIDIPGRAMQLYAYDHCLQTFGSNTFWMGFIDTDEFLVPKNGLNLKELLQGYEDYGGLAVSSLFFGSNGHQIRPAEGQIAAYTRRTHATFKENELVKNIIRPSVVLMPNSPHDFTFQEGNWCVNENLLRVDGQRFANCTEKIQINHYYCRSKHEIDQKLLRGRGDDFSSWSRARSDLVNLRTAYTDMYILENLDVLFQKTGRVSCDLLDASLMGSLLEKMAILTSGLRSKPLVITLPRESSFFRSEFTNWVDIRSRAELAKDRGDIKRVCQLLLDLICLQPQNTNLYIDLSMNYLHMGDQAGAWQALSKAWQFAPNTYAVLVGMCIYFWWMKNYLMAEKTCHLVLNIDPHNITFLGLLAEALLGQNRFEEAIKVGWPVVELSAQVGELPDLMGVSLVKKMADYFLEKKDYISAVRLWDAGVKCQPGDVNPLLELSKALLLAGDTTGARFRLAQAQVLAPKDETISALLQQVGAASELSAPIIRHPKRRH